MAIQETTSSLPRTVYTHCFVGTKACGCTTNVVLEDRMAPRSSLEHVLKNMRGAGLSTKYVTITEARKLLKRCTCNHGRYSLSPEAMNSRAAEAVTR